MVTFEIAGDSRTGNDISESWIAERFRVAKDRNRQPCVVAHIDTSDCKIRLATPNCNSGGGGGRLPNCHEAPILRLWDQAGLNRSDFAIGSVISFWKKLRQAA